MIAPAVAEARFLPFLFGAEARATSYEPSGENSQTMDLLKPEAAPVHPSKDKPKDEEAEEIKRDVSISIVADSALVPATSPFAGDEAIGGDVFASGEPSFYVVRPGDSIAQIAAMFEVSVDTILSANDMKKGDKLKEGEVLLILPFSGVEHTIARGETLQGIANKYKVPLNDILTANNLDKTAKIVTGRKLIIPGGDLLPEPAKVASGQSSAKSSSSAPSASSGYFKDPLPGSKRVRGIGGNHRGVDKAAPTGTPIYAAASGTVLIARNGWNGGYGNYVVIQHANGMKTLYAHMSRLGTSAGAKVSQGATVGYVGSTGRSTGPHLHFEVIGGSNPF